MKDTVMKSMTKVIAWMALLVAVGCATPRNQGGTSDTQTGSQDMGSRVAPGILQPETQPRGIPDNGSFMNDNGLNTDTLHEEKHWDGSNDTPYPDEDEAMKEEDWSSPPGFDNSNLDHPSWSLEDSEGSFSVSADGLHLGES
jgi:hypothetical protein